jgi:TRAP-type C4-dicarboxylate transport system permease small subunit
LASGQVSPALGLKFGYVYLAVPISGLFIVLFAGEQAVNAILGLDSVAADACEESRTDPSDG